MPSWLGGLLASLLKPLMVWLAGRQSGIDAQRRKNAEDTLEYVKRAEDAKRSVNDSDIADKLRDEFTRED